MKYTLRVTAPHYTAGLVFEWSGLQWVCRRAAPVVKWCIGLGAAEILAYFAQRGYACEWV